jgi:hypothetical protein
MTRDDAASRTALLRYALTIDIVVACAGTRRQRLCEEAVHYGFFTRTGEIQGLYFYRGDRDAIVGTIETEA